MGKIPVNGIIGQFQTMYREHWAYEMNAARKGCVDCSGAFVYAYRQYNKSIAHGSNTIGRKYIISLLPISEAKPGMAAFKCKEWTDEDKTNRWYGTEPGNLSHIGLVDQDVNYVLNAKGTAYGFSRDKLTNRNGWDYVAYLTDVEYTGGGGGGGTTVQVTISGGKTSSTINMRSGPGREYPIIEDIPQGATAELLGEDIGWDKIKYANKTGYVMSSFVHKGDTPTPPSPTPTGDTVAVPKAEIESIIKTMKAWLE